MKNSICRISLDVHDTSSQISLSVKKGDTARSIYITLTEKGKPYKIAEGCSATFEAKKADGNFIHNACRIEGNTIIYDLTAQTTAAVGATVCEIALFDEQGEKLTSPCFIMVVEGTVYNGEEIASTPEADALKVITEEAKVLIVTIEKKLEELKNTLSDYVEKNKFEDLVTIVNKILEFLNLNTSDTYLVSSDGYILQDKNGLYLKTKDAETIITEGAKLLSSDNYTLQDINELYLITKESA